MTQLHGILLLQRDKSAIMLITEHIGGDSLLVGRAWTLGAIEAAAPLTRSHKYIAETNIFK